MTDELIRLLRAGATPSADRVTTEDAVVGRVNEWWRMSRRRRLARRAVIGVGALVPFVIVCALLAVVSRPESVVTGPATVPPPTSSPGSSVPGAQVTLPINPGGGPSLRLLPESPRAGQPVKLSMINPDGVAYKLSPLTVIQRKAGTDWVTVSLTVTYTPGQADPRGMCGQDEPERRSGGGGGMPPWADRSADPRSMSEIFNGDAFRTPCATGDFVIGADTPELHRWSTGIVPGEHRLCRDAAPVAVGGADGQVDIGRAMRVCTQFTVAGSSPPLQRVDDPCPLPGDGTAPTALADSLPGQGAEMEGRPFGVAWPGGPNGDSALYAWRSPPSAMGSEAVTAVPLFDLNCTVRAYLVTGAGVVNAEDLATVEADPAVAKARKSFNTSFVPFEIAGPDADFRFEGQGSNVGDIIGRLRIESKGYDTDVVESLFNTGGRPGHIPTSPLPGVQGNAVFYGFEGSWDEAGRSVIPQLAPGDEVEVDVGANSFRYRVTSPPFTSGTVLQLLGDQGDERITLVEPGNGVATVITAIRVPS